MSRSRQSVTVSSLCSRYNTGQLKEDFEKIMITDELKTLANGERIELVVEMNVDEYISTRSHLEKLLQTKEEGREEEEEDEEKEEEGKKLIEVRIIHEIGFT
jgi:ABC-type transporter lipoprotein component MlaA